jgi:hypothetical protein
MFIVGRLLTRKRRKCPRYRNGLSINSPFVANLMALWPSPRDSESVQLDQPLKRSLGGTTSRHGFLARNSFRSGENQYPSQIAMNEQVGDIRTKKMLRHSWSASCNNSSKFSRNLRERTSTSLERAYVDSTAVLRILLIPVFESMQELTFLVRVQFC